MEKYTIYVHINTINNKIYIGQTKQTLSRRFRSNGEGYKHNTNFFNDIQKYGWKNFKHIVLIENLTLEEADEVECYLIKKYNSDDPKIGYNKAIGRHGFSSLSSTIISEGNKEKWKNGVYDNIKNSVYCIELGIDFESALEAERQTGVDNSSIQKTCNNKIKYCGYSPQGKPLHWIFTKDKNENIINELYFKPETIKGVSIPVYCPELNQTFSSTKEVFEQYKIDPSNIRKTITGKQKSAGRHPITNEPLHWIEKPELIQAKNKLSQETWDNLCNYKTKG